MRKKSIIQKYIRLLTVAIFGLTCPAAPAFAAASESPALNQSDANGSATVLQGGLKHSEVLPGLDENLQIGKVYSDDLLLKPGQKTSKEWFLIPPWYAGVRHSENALIFSRYDYVSGETTRPMLNQLNRQNATAGFQKDKEGGIWDFKHVPLIQHLESNLTNAVLFVQAITPLSGSADRLMIKYNEISISLNKKTNEIVDIVQQEQINTITSPSPNTLRVDVSVRAFDADGKPQRQEESVIMSEMIKPYEQCDTFNGEDLRPSFKDYLVAHHLENLVPDNLK